MEKVVEKVIFREEKDGGFLAIFPEDSANINGYGAIAFKLNDNGESFGAWFEPYMEINYLYMMSCKIIHKTDKRVPRLVKELETFYDLKFEVREKITAEMDRKRTAFYRRSNK